MTKKIIDLIFQLDGDFSLLSTENKDWFEFFNNIIDGGSNRISAYIVLKKENGLEFNKEFATKFKRKIISKEIIFCEYAFEDVEQNLLTLTTMKDNKKVFLDKENTIFFATSKEIIELLYIQNIFSVFLNINTNKYDEKEIKQIFKMSKLFINDDEIDKYTYEPINYEFLTFLEKNEN